MLVRVIAVVCLIAVSPMVSAQGLQVAFAGLGQTTDQPIEIAADTMAIDQDDGSAVLTGNVVIGQGDLRMTASRVTIDYTQEGGISEMFAVGGVVIVTPEEEVESTTALYKLADDSIFLSGDVLLVQGRSTVLSETMRVDLTDGTALLEGRVRTVLQPTE